MQFCQAQINDQKLYNTPVPSKLSGGQPIAFLILRRERCKGCEQHNTC